jgi:hypothetical protein
VLYEQIRFTDYDRKDLTKESKILCNQIGISQYFEKDPNYNTNHKMNIAK